MVTVSGGAIRDNFEAAGSKVTIASGLIGNGFDALAASEVNIAGGSVGDDFDVGNSIVNISGGSVGTELFAFGDSVVNLSNGSIGDDFHSDDLQTGKRPFLKIAGGSIGDRAAIRDTDVSMSGGQIGNDFLVAGSSVFNMSGGTIGTGLFVSHNAVVKISGGIIGSNFRVDSNGSGKSPVVQISGGLFDGMIADSDSIVHISGGTFNAYETGWISSSKTYITGGTFGVTFNNRAILLSTSPVARLAITIQRTGKRTSSTEHLEVSLLSAWRVLSTLATERTSLVERLAMGFKSTGSQRPIFLVGLSESTLM